MIDLDYENNVTNKATGTSRKNSNRNSKDQREFEQDVYFRKIKNLITVKPC
jgi:hypothetical protein